MISEHRLSETSITTQTIAAAIVVGVILHAGNHLSCDFPRLISSSDDMYRGLKDDFGDSKPSYIKLVRGPEGVTGILMVVLMAVAFTLATRWFRRSLVKLPKPFNRLTGFNAFWYSHHLFVIVYVLLIVHGQYLYLVHSWYRKTVPIQFISHVEHKRQHLFFHDEINLVLCLQTWMYLSVPVLLYAGERILRALRSGYYSVRMLKV